MNPKQVRRKLIKAFGIGGATAIASSVDPLAMIFKSVTHGIIARARAQATGSGYKKYVNFFQTGGAPKWTFDMWLTPYDTATFTPNDHVGTRFTESGGRYTGVEYATWAYNGINLPWMWQWSVPRAGGGDRPLTELLNNLLVIQGIDTVNNNHEGATTLHFQPLGAVQSLGSVVGDVGTSPIPVVFAGMSATYTSLAGVSPVATRGWGNLIELILDPFRVKTGSGFQAQKALVQAELDAAMTTLDNYARSRHPGADTVARSLASAQDMVVQASIDVRSTWDNLYNKYRDIERRSMDPNVILPGINDRPIGITTTRGGEYNMSNNLVNNPDLRTMIVPRLDGSNRSQFNVGNLAGSFAVTEYLISQNISDYVCARLAGSGGYTVNGGGGDNPYDEHETGKMISLLCNTYSNRAIGAAMLEFIDRMKSAGRFSEMTIELSSEFGRNARSDGTGSDHGNDSKSVTLWSEDISGTHCIGDLQNNYSRSDYAGSWGAGSPIPELGNVPLNLGHYASSVATLLGRPSPVTAFPSLLASGSSGITPIIPPTRQR